MNKIFLIKGAALVMTVCMFSFCSSEKKAVVVAIDTEMKETKTLEIGVQLYTVRDAMSADVVGTLSKIAKIGYTNLELASYDQGKFYGMEPVDFKAITDSLGLNIISSHMPHADLTGDFEQVLAASKALGLKYIVLPWISDEYRTIAHYENFIKILNEIGPLSAKEGIKVTYHNHDFEFDTLDGKVPMQMILDGTSPEFVNIELDLYWVSKAGLDPIEFMAKYPGRFIEWHVKDMDATESQNFTEVGNGVIDYASIFEVTSDAGMEYFFVEQDQSGDPMKSLEISYANVTKLLK
ncbi:MAG: sugar phosphate isomerase/epimerase [Reichenbachiella sp.]